MATALPIFGVVFAASCVWLMVRIINRRERWAKRTLLDLFFVPVLYVLSFGPACWWLSPVEQLPIGNMQTVRGAPRIYVPLGWLARREPLILRPVINWYATFGLGNQTIYCETEFEGRFDAAGRMQVIGFSR